MSDYDSDSSIESVESAREYHERWCREGDGWSHAFDVKYSEGDVTYSEGKIEAISMQNWWSLYSSRERRARSVLQNHFTADNWGRVADALSQSSALKTINLINCGLRGEQLAALFGRLTLTSELGLRLLLSNNSRLGGGGTGGEGMGPTGFAQVLPFLRSQSKLASLSLCGNDLRDEGARLLSEAMNHVCIGELTIQDNGIGDEGIELLLSAGKSVHLKKLWLVENDEERLPVSSIGRRGAEALSRFLGREETELTMIFVHCTDEELALMLVQSLSTNTHLEHFGGRLGNGGSRLLMESKEKLVCDRTSFESLCQSNHRISRFGWDHPSDAVRSSDTLLRALEINKQTGFWSHTARSPVAKRIMTKLFTGEGSFPIDDVVEIKLMPYILAALVSKEGKEACNKSIGSVYHIIRSCHMPQLFCFPSRQQVMIQELEREVAALKAELEKSAIVERKRHCTFGSSPLNLLPKDGLASVVGYLMGKDLKSLFLTCSAMCTVAERVAKEKTQRVSHLVPPGPITVTTRYNAQMRMVDWTRLDGSNDHDLSAPEDVKAWVGAYHYLQKITNEIYYFTGSNLAVERFINSEEERFEFGQTYLKVENNLALIQRESDLIRGFVIRGGCISVREGEEFEGQPALTLAANTMLATGRHAIICRLFVPGSGGTRSNRDATNNKLGAVGVLRTNPTDAQGPPASWAQRVELTEGWLTEDIVFGLAYDAESRELVVHSNAYANRVSRFHSIRYTVREGEGDLRIGLELTAKSARVPFTLLGVRHCSAEEWTSFVRHTRMTNPGGVAMDGAAARAVAAFDFMDSHLDALNAMDENDDNAVGLDGLDLAGGDAGDARRVIRQRFMRQALQRRRRAREAAAGNVGDVRRRNEQEAEPAQVDAANNGVAERPARRVVRALRPYARAPPLPERQHNRDPNGDAAPPMN